MAFVNRRKDLDRLSRFATAVARGAPERNVAVIGVRRIGKSYLLEQFAASQPPVMLVKLAGDSASTTLHQFLLAMVRSTISALVTSRGGGALSSGAGNVEIAASAARLGQAVSEVTQRALALAAERRPTGDRLLTAGASFPEEAGAALGVPVIVVMDEFQHVAHLANFQPYRAAGRSTQESLELLLGALRPHVERRRHCGWLVTGSSVRMITEMLSTRLMGRFDEIRLGPLDADDCGELVARAFDEEDVHATDSAANRIFRLTLGHPFYADITAREAAVYALRLQQAVSTSMVERAFLESVQRPGGQIRLACEEMLTSIGQRTGPLRAVLDTLAPRAEATLGELAAQAGLEAPLMYRYAETLERIGVVARPDKSTLHFADSVFRYYVAQVLDPLVEPPDLGNPVAARAAVRRFEEAFLREREQRGILTEAYVRDLARNFAGQQINGQYLGRPGQHVLLPVEADVRQITAPDPEGTVFGYPAQIELDLCVGDWLGEVRDRRSQTSVADIELADKKARFIRQAHGLPDGPTWFISFGGFAQVASERARELGIYTSNSRDVEALRAKIGARTPATRTGPPRRRR